MKTYFGALLLFFIMTSCTTQPEPINYGTDACHFCKMTIVTKTHSAQAVSSKGKQFKYDAIECMVNDLNSDNQAEMSVLLVANYLNAGEMIPAETASYLVSENIPSPMGGNLSATTIKADAEQLRAKNGGEVLDWNTLKNKSLTPNHNH